MELTKTINCCLIFQAKVNPESGVPVDELDTETKGWVASLGSSATKISELVNDKDGVVSLCCFYLLLQAKDDGILFRE